MNSITNDIIDTIDKKYEEVINKAFVNADNNVSNITNDIINIDGMSGTKTRHFYNNLLNFEDARYLEIGTWKGSSVCSAMYKNNAKVVCIDNWSEFNGPKQVFLDNFNKYKGNNDAQFIESDSFKVDVSLLPKFNVYLYDGDHSDICHYNALVHFYNCLDDTFIFIVDDWNWENVRKQTYKSIDYLKLTILFQKEIILPSVNKETWWNGIFVAILQKQN
jgi:hypothetical protein